MLKTHAISKLSWDSSIWNLYVTSHVTLIPVLSIDLSIFIIASSTMGPEQGSGSRRSLPFAMIRSVGKAMSGRGGCGFRNGQGFTIRIKTNIYIYTLRMPHDNQNMATIDSKFGYLFSTMFWRAFLSNHAGRTSMRISTSTWWKRKTHLSTTENMKKLWNTIWVLKFPVHLPLLSPQWAKACSRKHPAGHVAPRFLLTTPAMRTCWMRILRSLLMMMRVTAPRRILGHLVRSVMNNMLRRSLRTECFTWYKCHRNSYKFWIVHRNPWV